MKSDMKPANKSSPTVKFLCSYDGKILPRPSDGKIRYVGGHTRVLSVHRSISFSELMVKLVELCGNSVTLRCQLPSEELDDVLVSIKSDEDLANVIEVYDRASSMSSRELKIRAFLYPLKAAVSSPTSSSSSSAASCTDSSSPTNRRSSPPAPPRSAIRQVPAPGAGIRPTCYNKYDAVRSRYHPCNLQANHGPAYLAPHPYRLH
ncbi:hypothetical protein Dimus_023774 [Dionaea muscipula]